MALTKCDLVDEDAIDLVTEDVRDRLRGTVLEDAPIVQCSSQTGEGMDLLVEALDAMVAAAADPAEDDRPRLFVDRVFTVTGAGTIVTGTLTGGRLSVGQEVELLPAGVGGRIRGLQTHGHAVAEARAGQRTAVLAFESASLLHAAASATTTSPSTPHWRSPFRSEFPLWPAGALRSP